MLNGKLHVGRKGGDNGWGPRDHPGSRVCVEKKTAAASTGHMATRSLPTALTSLSLAQHRAQGR